MVQFPRFRFRTLCIHVRMAGSRLPGYPIRPPADHKMCAPPRRFSQLAAAFLAAARLGIRRKPSSRLTILLFVRIFASASIRQAVSKSNFSDELQFTETA